MDKSTEFSSLKHLYPHLFGVEVGFPFVGRVGPWVLTHSDGSKVGHLRHFVRRDDKGYPMKNDKGNRHDDRSHKTSGHQVTRVENLRRGVTDNMRFCRRRYSYVRRLWYFQEKGWIPEVIPTSILSLVKEK